MFHIILLIVFLDILSLVVIVTLHNATYFIFLIIFCDFNTLFGDPYNLTYTNIEIIVYTNIHWQEFFFNPNPNLAIKRNQGLKCINMKNIKNVMLQWKYIFKTIIVVAFYKLTIGFNFYRTR